LPQLEKLLRHLIFEIEGVVANGFSNCVNIIISNNASNDGTEFLCEKYKSSFLSYVNLPVNVGGDKNIRLGFESVSTGYLWILGDDDFPYPGLLSFIVYYLCKYTPDILALKADWVTEIKNTEIRNSSNYFSVDNFSNIKFMELIHVSLTFISSFIINVDSLNKTNNKIAWEHVDGSNFEQLAPYSALLVNGSKFGVVKPVALIATGNTSFNYSVARVFGVDLPRIAKALFEKDPRLSSILISKLLTSYLPIFIYNFKYNHYSFSSKSDLPWDEFKNTHASSWRYWIFVFPLKYFPKPISFLVVAMGRILR